MKTSEEKRNEALRGALKRKFDDFEGEPHPSSYNIIRAHLKQPRNYKYLLLTILFVGIFVVGIKMDQHWLEKAPVAKGVSEKPYHTRKASVTETDQVEPNVQRQVSETATNRIEPNFRRQVSGAVTNQIKPNSPRQISKNAIKRNLPQEVSGIAADLPQVVSGIAPNLHQEVLLSATSISELEPEQMKLVGMDLPEVKIPEIPQEEHAIHTNPQKISWLVNIASLKTYQILTVPTSAGKDFQNFKFPSALALESIGYKMSAGFEKKGFRLMLNYSTFRQKYSYEIAGDKYVVENSGQTNYNIVRPGTVVTENNKLDLLGVGVSKQIEWGGSAHRRAPRQYYALAGFEYSHAVNSGQGIGWINAGFGKQFAVNRTVLLNIGPYAEFSPLKISGAGNPFLYQPYRVGISLGMKLIRP